MQKGHVTGFQSHFFPGTQFVKVSCLNPHSLLRYKYHENHSRNPSQILSLLTLVLSSHGPSRVCVSFQKEVVDNPIRAIYIYIIYIYIQSIQSHT